MKTYYTLKGPNGSFADFNPKVSCEEQPGN